MTRRHDAEEWEWNDTHEDAGDLKFTPGQADRFPGVRSQNHPIRNQLRALWQSDDGYRDLTPVIVTECAVAL